MRCLVAKALTPFAGAAAALLLCGALAHADERSAATPAGVGSWDNSVTQDQSGGRTFTDSQLAAIKSVSDYFNDLDTLTARFIQTDANQVPLKGKVYVKKPGRFRFEYNRPSRKVVISDGRFMAIQNLDLRTDETYELKNTPFRMLLREKVDLLRSAEVVQVEELPGQISLVVRDKDPDAPSAIKIVLSTAPEKSLRGWITRDAQGLETKVELFGVQHGESLAAKLFKRENLFSFSRE